MTAPVIHPPLADSLTGGRKRHTQIPALIYPLIAIALLLTYNAIFRTGFFHVEIREGHLYGSLVDIASYAAGIALVSLGMTLVIATGGVDLSVGAIMAITGTVAAYIVVNTNMPFGVAMLAAIGVGILCGFWNGALVAGLGIQPIIATLILMVAGRAIAQLISDGQIINFKNASFAYFGGGYLYAVPFTVVLTVICSLLLWLVTRRTGLGLMIEVVGDNPAASRMVGIHSRTVITIAYVFSGLFAALAGLIEASRINSADASHAGLYRELDSIFAVVVGGTALTGGRFTIAGSIIGAILLQTLTTSLYAADVGPDLMPMPKALLIVAVCLIQSDRTRLFTKKLFNRVKGSN